MKKPSTKTIIIGAALVIPTALTLAMPCAFIGTKIAAVASARTAWVIANSLWYASTAVSTVATTAVITK